MTAQSWAERRNRPGFQRKSRPLSHIVRPMADTHPRNPLDGLPRWLQASLAALLLTAPIAGWVIAPESDGTEPARTEATTTTTRRPDMAQAQPSTTTTMASTPSSKPAIDVAESDHADTPTAPQPTPGQPTEQATTTSTRPIPATTQATTTTTSPPAEPAGPPDGWCMGRDDTIVTLTDGGLRCVHPDGTYDDWYP